MVGRYWQGKTEVLGKTLSQRHCERGTLLTPPINPLGHDTASCRVRKGVNMVTNVSKGICNIAAPE